MKKIPKISVIIPLYNTEKYIGDCLDSVLSQNYPNLEIIVVDDGSTDNSVLIAKSYKVNVIEQKNMGVSVARNTGINAATGEYIHFIDADDKLLNNDFYERVMNGIGNADIAVVGVVDEKYGDKPVENFKSEKLYYGKQSKISISKVARRPAVWRFVFRRRFLIKNKLKFESGRITSQDVMFTIPAIFYATAIATIPNAFYWYRRAPLGAMRDPARALAREQNKKIVWDRAVKFAVKNRFFLGFRRSFFKWLKMFFAEK
ncbi:MAG: glycosyltransferase [Alphaproteobacteria bacterium]